MGKYQVQADFDNIVGFTHNAASLWVVIKTIYMLVRYDNEPPLTLTISKVRNGDS